MISVKATREGLIGQATASTYVIDRIVPFIALPSRRALGRFVRLRNPLNDRQAYAIVLDVGPWYTDDDAYVFDGARPRAENGRPRQGVMPNGAGIDLGERIWKTLGMRDNTAIEWEFLPELDLTRHAPRLPKGPQT